MDSKNIKKDNVVEKFKKTIEETKWLTYSDVFRSVMVNYNETIKCMEIINSEFMLQHHEGFRNPTLIKDWTEYIFSKLGYDSTKTKKFLVDWILQKQKYIRSEREHGSIVNKKNYLKYCLELDYYLTTQVIPRNFFGHFYKSLYIVNKSTMMLIHSDVCKIDPEDMLLQSSDLSVELLLESFVNNS
jgi:hypothetical protein